MHMIGLPRRIVILQARDVLWRCRDRDATRLTSACAVAIAMQRTVH
jgi:hypothetical protein